MTKNETLKNESENSSRAESELCNIALENEENIAQQEQEQQIGTNEGQGNEKEDQDNTLDREKELEKEIAELKDSLLRSHADFDNYRKRVQKEKEEWFQYACQGLVEKLLPVLDNFERALLSVNELNEETKNVLSGIKMIEKQFREILQKEGLEPIEAVGASFDPLIHEAVMQVPAEEGVADNQIVEEVLKGYLFKGKLLRASMVKVAVGE
ncbi:MAG: nucleotide exchange factor GrpE [Clostridia bacterium]|jgi:molecular chaperone GrpE|nr:nucleotide exchange factor GrpE [Clostridia bacterium]